MITKYKIFERMSDIEVENLKPGDIIIYNYGKRYWHNTIPDIKIPIKKGKKYIVEEIRDYLVSVKDYKTKKKFLHPNTGKEKFFFIKDFLTEIEVNANKYNL